MENFYDGFDFDISNLAVRYGQYDGKIDYKQIATKLKNNGLKIDIRNIYNEI